MSEEPAAPIAPPPESDAELLSRTGKLRIAEFGIELREGMTLRQFLAKVPKSRRENGTFSSPFRSYVIRNCFVLGFAAILEVSFEAENLFEVTIDPEIEGDTGYYSSRPDLLQEYAKKQWALFAEKSGIPTPAKLPWGEVWGGEGETRSWTSSIYLTYKRPSGT